MSLLDAIDGPDDLKALPEEDLPIVAREIRERIVDTVCNKTGGHFASNLGVVELTIALHRVFSFPHDRLLLDVGHQAYPHKLLTGRREQFDTIRQRDGLSGFANKFESPYDTYLWGHAGTSISCALGLAWGRSLPGRRAAHRRGDRRLLDRRRHGVRGAEPRGRVGPEPPRDPERQPHVDSQHHGAR